MSMTEMTSRQKAVTLLVVAVALTLIIGVGLLLSEYAPGNMGTGFLAGAGVAIIGVIVMSWRVLRSPSDATTFERAFTSRGDERDDVVPTKSLAVLGLLALPVSGIAAVAIGLGANMMMVLFLLLVVEAAIGVIAFAVNARRY